MENTVISKNGIVVRLTDERWAQITEEHAELAGLRFDALETVAAPSRIIEGNAGELLALHEVLSDKWLVVMYRELASDGFVITAFLTRRIRALEARRQLWP